MDYALPVLYAAFVWWFSTGAILLLNRLPRATYPWSMAAATAALGGALYGLAESGATASPAAAYLAFTCAVIVWGWHEMSFLMGYVAGPRKEACPPDCRGWRRFTLAAQTLIYHEAAIAATAALIAFMLWDAPNQVGLWTFLILWAMRLSAKLNIHLGAPNLSDEMLPEHLKFLKSYFRKRPMNPLFPVSVTAGTALAALLGAAAATGDAFAAAGFSLLCALTALAVLEHWFFMLPLPDAALWRWAMQAPRGLAGEAGSASQKDGAARDGTGGARERRLRAGLGARRSVRPGRAGKERAPADAGEAAAIVTRAIPSQTAL